MFVSPQIKRKCLTGRHTDGKQKMRMFDRTLCKREMVAGKYPRAYLFSRNRKKLKFVNVWIFDFQYQIFPHRIRISQLKTYPIITIRKARIDKGFSVGFKQRLLC